MTAVRVGTRDSERQSEVSAAWRPDIQALRALAVLSVLLFHLFPTRLTGGFVGVDVFFVISGFLITSHLLRELEGTGRHTGRRDSGPVARSVCCRPHSSSS